jgi:hypothetical protein
MEGGSAREQEAVAKSSREVYTDASGQALVVDRARGIKE